MTSSPGSLVDRLAGVCGDVSGDEPDLAETGADRWTLAPALGRAEAVVRPGSVEEVSAVLALCHEARVPVTPAGGRSGVCGGAVAAHGGVALDLRGLSGVVAVDEVSMLVDVAAGTFGDVLEAQLRSGHALTAGHWPQSMAISTVGGWLACRSAGQYSTRYGKIEDMVAGLQVVLADGRVIRTGGGPRAALGPDLTQVFVGSEGTLGVITEARLRLRPAPVTERRAVFGLRSFAAGIEACRLILRRSATPAALRLYDPVDAGRAFGPGLRGPNAEAGPGCVLVVVDEGDPVAVDATMAVVAEECAGAERLPDELAARWLASRNDVSAYEEALRSGVVGDTAEMAAPWRALAPLYDDVVAAVGAVEHCALVSAHLSHAYSDGACLYFTFAGRPPHDERRRFYVAAWDAAAAASRRCGATLSHHHGVGLNKARFLPEALGPAFDVLVGLKRALDGRGILNPGKLGLPHPFGPPAFP